MISENADKALKDLCAEFPDVTIEQARRHVEKKCHVLWDEFGIVWLGRDRTLHIHILPEFRCTLLWQRSLIKNMVLKKALSIYDPIYTFANEGNPMIRISKMVGFEDFKKVGDDVWLVLHGKNLTNPMDA